MQDSMQRLSQRPLGLSRGSKYLSAMRLFAIIAIAVTVLGIFVGNVLIANSAFWFSILKIMAIIVGTVCCGFKTGFMRMVACLGCLSSTSKAPCKHVVLIWICSRRTESHKASLVCQSMLSTVLLSIQVSPSRMP